MKAILLLLGAAAASLASPGAAAQTSDPEPPRSKPATSATSTPPPANSKDDSYGATDALDHTQRATSTIFNGAVIAGEGSRPSLTVRRDARQFNKYLDGAGKAIEVAGDAQTAYDVGGDIAKGDYAGAARKGGAAIVEKCIDAAINAGCRAATLTYTGPASAVTGPLCVAAVTTVKEVCDSKLKEYTGSSMSDWVIKGAEATAGAASDTYKAIRDEMSQNFARTKAEVDARRTEMAARNEAALFEQAARDRAAQEAAAQSAANYDDMQMMNNLMQGIGTIGTPPAAAAPVPMAPPTPTGCHSGHDETSHPGGCNKPPLGTAN